MKGKHYADSSWEGFTNTARAFLPGKAAEMIPTMPAITKSMPTAALKYPVIAPMTIPYTIPPIFKKKKKTGKQISSVVCCIALRQRSQ